MGPTTNPPPWPLPIPILNRMLKEVNTSIVWVYCSSSTFLRSEFPLYCLFKKSWPVLYTKLLYNWVKTSWTYSKLFWSITQSLTYLITHMCNIFLIGLNQNNHDMQFFFCLFICLSDCRYTCLLIRLSLVCLSYGQFVLVLLGAAFSGTSWFEQH